MGRTNLLFFEWWLYRWGFKSNDYFVNNRVYPNKMGYGVISNKIIDLFDEFNADTASLISYLLDDNGQIKEEYINGFSQNIFYLDRLYVSEKYRGQGFAKLLLNNLRDILKYMVKIDYAVSIIQAQPFDVIDGKGVMDYKDNDRKERLIKLYENCGYIRIDDSNYLYQINVN